MRIINPLISNNTIWSLQKPYVSRQQLLFLQDKDEIWRISSEEEPIFTVYSPASVPHAL